MDMISDKKRFWKEFLWMNVATVMISVGVYCFKFPNNFSMGGVSGLSILLGKVLPVLSASSYNTIINVLFLILGFLMLDKSFGFRTVYCSLLSAGLIQVFSWVWPLTAPLTDQLMLELFFAVILPALGAAILFNIDASSGGTDIAAMILKKYTGLDVGTALLISAPCWVWPSSRCWWTRPSSLSTAGRPSLSSPPTRNTSVTM